MSVWRRCIAALALAMIGVQGHAAPAPVGIVCHITYGGETQQVTALPVASPYEVKATQIGSYFLFRAVVQSAPADIAAIKLYVYGDTDAGPVPIHQADYPYTPATLRTKPFGFTGLHRVYETIRDGEMEYWCHWQSARRGSK